MFAGSSAKHCRCPAGMTDNGDICIVEEDVECFYNEFLTWDNKCEKCGENCSECSDYTGVCQYCTDKAMEVDPTDS